MLPDAVASGMKGSSRTTGEANQQVSKCVLQSVVLEEYKVWSGDDVRCPSVYLLLLLVNE